MKKQLFPFQLLYISCISFLVLTTIGMLYFPGGTILDPNTKGYSFFNNFFSELGRWRAISGETKWVSFFTFTGSVVLQALAMLVFNLYFLKRINSIQLHRGAHYTALASGFAFPFLLAGIGLTPCDVFLPMHMICVKTGFSLLLPMSISYTILIRKHHLLPNRYGNVMLSIVVGIGIYLFMLFNGPDPHKVPFIQQTAQKIIVYSMVFSLLYLSSGAIRFLQEPEA